MAATVDVVVDSADIQLESAGDGKHTGKVTLSNISAARVTLAASIPADNGCSITPDPTSVDSGRRTQVTLTFSAGCDVKSGADVRLDYGPGVSPPSEIIKVAAAPKKEPNWSTLWLSFPIGAGLALVAVGYALVQMSSYNENEPNPEKRFGRKTPLPYLGTSWSFKDNWVGNVTVGSAALVALLASSDVLTAILGSKPEAALSLLVVASALAAVFVAIGPLLVKAIGDDSAVPTVAGMLAAGFVTLTGTLGQVTAVTWQGIELVSGDHFHVKEIAVCLLAVAIVGVVIWYAAGALWDFAESGSKKPRKKPSEAVTAAKIIARAIRGEPPLGGLEVQDDEEQLALVEIPVSPDGRNALL
jgi:hypothetical protein